VSDADEAGEPTVTNGLSLCSIHHRAFDEDLVGVSPDYVVEVHPRLRDEEDGPMLALLQGAHGESILVPRRTALRPDRELLAQRFERFRATS
jgi:putative restriction endonuclease